MPDGAQTAAGACDRYIPTRTEQERKGADAAERAGAEQPNEKAAETGGPFSPADANPSHTRLRQRMGALNRSAIH